MVWHRPSAVSLALGIRVDESDQAETCHEANLFHVSRPPYSRLAQPNKQAVASKDLSSGSTWSNRPLRLDSRSPASSRELQPRQFRRIQSCGASQSSDDLRSR